MQAILKNDPLADGSTPEILVDNDNPESTKVTGTWVTKRRGAYGKTFYIKESGQSGNNEILYTPVFKKAGRYQAYAYFPKVDSASTKTHIEVFDGKQRKEIIVHRSDIKVVGQTLGEWVPLGTYSFPEGSRAYVRISDKDADGVIVADALLLCLRPGIEDPLRWRFDPAINAKRMPNFLTISSFLTISNHPYGPASH